MSEGFNSYNSAIEDFREARRQAAIQELLSRIRGESVQLLSFDEVRQKLRAVDTAERGLQEVPLDSILGSVGRYKDFTRDFLPRTSAIEERWARVKLAASDLAGLPPIEVYKIGEVYFVKDGNHRVSVARQLGAPRIQAYVTEIKTRVPFTPDMDPNDLILAAEYANFLEKTHLDELRPGADLRITVPGKYEVLLEHIAVHRYYMGIEQQREIPYQEAATHWYETVYLPVIQVIRELGILQDFPDRTETDLYLWLSEHRTALQEELGWQIPTEKAAIDLVQQRSEKPDQVLARLGNRLLGAITLNGLESGPPAGQWRRERLGWRQGESLFNQILVAFNGLEDGWLALEQAIIVARREGAEIHGLHVVPSQLQIQSEAAQKLRADFRWRLGEVGLRGDLFFSVGQIPERVSDRARWNDLVVTSLAYPPEPSPLSRLGSGFRKLIQRLPRPALVTPRTTSPLTRLLLAYDDSPKAREALYISAYLSTRWQLPLVVLTVLTSGENNLKAQDSAHQYLQEYGIQAELATKSGPVADMILEACGEYECDLILMGGYSYSPMLEVVLGSAVDQVLRQSEQPMLICR